MVIPTKRIVVSVAIALALIAVPSAAVASEQGGGTISGRVTASATGAAVAGAQVRIYRISNGTTLIETATTNASGDYATLTLLVAATYAVVTSNTVGSVISLLAPVPAGTYYIRITPVNNCGAGAASDEAVVTIGQE